MHKRKYLTGFLLLLVTVIMVMAGCFPENPDKTPPETVSTSSGSAPFGKIINTDAGTNNLMNNGFVAADGDTTYFTRDGYVYRIKEAQSPEKFTDTKANQMSAAGSYIYLTNTFNQPFKIQIMKRDGSPSQTIYRDDRQRFVVYNDGKWIYYHVLDILICRSDRPEPGEEPRMYEYSTLYRMKADGSSNEKVLSYIYSLRPPYISDGWIYYSCQPPDWAIEQEKLSGVEEGFFKIRLDGTGKSKLLDNPPFSAVVKQGEWLFYSAEGLFKLKIDGSENIKLCDDHAAAVNVKDEWVYFTSFDDQISLYRIDWQGNNRQKMSQTERVQDISIAGNWIYFRAYEGQNLKILRLHRVKPDGTGEEMLNQTGSGLH